MTDNKCGINQSINHEDTGSDHRVIIWETRRDPTTNTLPSKVGKRIRYDISRMREDDKDEAELLLLTASETRPTLDDFSFCEDIESEPYGLRRPSRIS
jgi:hypothetical protein